MAPGFHIAFSPAKGCLESKIALHALLKGQKYSFSYPVRCPLPCQGSCAPALAQRLRVGRRLAGGALPAVVPTLPTASATAIHGVENLASVPF